MFDNNKLGEIRPNQLITTFGPGSIVDAVKDSVTVLDLNYWKEKGKKIIDGRLASYLGVDCFYMPRTSYSGDILVVSFPYMHVCSNVKCGRIFDLRENFDLDRYLKFGVTCPECHRQAYPSRFITICENGHMDDFPWSWWVHGGNTICKGTMRMSGVLLYTGSADKEGSLGGLVELGNIDQLIVLMKDAFQEALVCTNDPECLNNVPAGNNSNGAACHSCCMISETACENGNRMLDRGLIVPIDGRENQSYFKTLVEELCQLEV